MLSSVTGHAPLSPILPLHSIHPLQSAPEPRNQPKFSFCLKLANSEPVTQKNLMCGNALSPYLLVGAPFLGCLSERKGNLSPKTKPPLFLGASRTSPKIQRQLQKKLPRPEKVGCQERHKDLRNNAGNPLGKTSRPTASRPTAHLKHRPPYNHQRARSGRPGHPRPTPWSTPAGKGQIVLELDVVGWSRAQRKGGGNAGGEGG